MIRPEFRTLLIDQRGAAVILWSCFVTSIPIYIVILRKVLSDSAVAAHGSFATAVRSIVWLLTLVDIGYYVYWRRRNLTVAAILRDAGSSKLFHALEEFQGAAEQRAAQVISTYVTRKVVIFAIIEAIAVYGVISAILGRYVFDQYFLSGVSLVLLVLEYPYERASAQLLRLVEQESGGTS